MKWYKHIPNAVSLLNLTTGAMGIVLSMDQPAWGCFAIFLAAIFDVLDGLLARLLKATSSIGKDLDSLADMVSFGLLPAIIAIGAFNLLYLDLVSDTVKTICLAGFLLVPALSGLRLARFNNDPGQKHYFKGLPTPANALFVAGFCLSIFFEGGINSLLQEHIWLFAALILVPALLLNAPFKMLSFKVKKEDRRAVGFISALVFISVFSFIVLGWISALIILPLYLLLSGINQLIHEIQSRN